MQSDLLKVLKDYHQNRISYEDVALKICNVQKVSNPTYRSYCESINRADVITSIHDIPYLPISAFKSHQVLSDEIEIESCTEFTSSGTTGSVPSRHYVTDLHRYHEGAQQIYESDYGLLSEYHVYGLLPSYLERTGSSLVSMVDYFIHQSKGGGFYLSNYDQLHDALTSVNGKKLLIGVSFGLLDFAETYRLPKSEDLVVMETGGMKGRSKEIPRSELHQILMDNLNVKQIHSEYGMTELLSQAYSKGNGVFDENPWMKVSIRSVSDPFSLVNPGKTGVMRIVDLHNIDSCAFIETEDLGRKIGDHQFEVLGRLDNSDLRGCNLMVS